MTDYLTPSAQTQVPRTLIWTGTGFVAGGALLALAGSGLIGSAVIVGLRRHVRNSGLPPSELAIHHWRRAKGAARAGADHWRSLPLPVTTSLSTPRQSAPARVG